jgi:putative tryptophan/tyrosine transport system substrate-binding protein
VINRNLKKRPACDLDDVLTDGIVASCSQTLNHMLRREFVTFSTVAAAWPVFARAQQAEPVRRVGVLTGFSKEDLVGEAVLSAFRQQLSAEGWVEGRNISLEIRWGDATSDSLRGFAAELVRMRPDVIVVHGSRSLMAVRQQTDKIPIVFTSISDPVKSGYVASLARPGGNVTGLTVYAGSPSPKLLEWLKEIAPRTTRVAFVMTPDNLGLAAQLTAIKNAAPSMKVQVAAMLIRSPTDIGQTIAAFAREPHGGLIVTSDIFMITHRDLLIAAAAEHRLPAVYQDRSFVVAGGLMSYSVDRRENYRGAANYVSRILKGFKPSELPVQQPQRFEAVLNLKTAKALGFQVSRLVLARVDEIID